MVASIFKEFVSKYLTGLAKKITEKYNGKSEDVVFFYKKYLSPELSVDLKFKSLSVNKSIVAADIVSLDSELPLKMRGAMSTATGDVPKLGMKKALSETQLTELQTLRNMGNQESNIVQKLFSDMADGIKGIHERLDIMFLQALSSGVTLINDDINVGSGIRLDFGIPAANQFGVTGKWSEAGATPIDDIDNVLRAARAHGNTPRVIWMDTKTFNYFKTNDQVKAAFAGSVRVPSANIFRLRKEEIESFLADEFGLTLMVIDKVVQIEKAGKKTAYEPWASGSVAFTTSTQLGTLTYGMLAESQNPVSGVEYATVDNFILVSMYRKNDPLQETTSVQALAIPILDNVDSIYLMDSEEATAAEETQTESDSKFDYEGEEYTLASVVAGINAARAVDTQVAVATTSQLDATLAKKIDQLSEAGIALFEAELIEAGA